MTAVTSDKSSLEHLLYRNPHISPTLNEGAQCIMGYARNIVGLDGMLHIYPDILCGDMFLHKKFCIFYTKILFHQFFLTKNFIFLHQKNFLHQKF